MDRDDIEWIFMCAENLEYSIEPVLKGKCYALFFPKSSIRTRLSYEKALHLLGADIVLFPSNTLDKKESAFC